MKHPLSRLLAVFSLALPLCFAPSAGAQAPAKVEQFTLPNGLTVIVKPDRRAPTAVHMLWVRVGAMDEVDGTSGVAHVLEHMMFKGTPELGVGEFSRRVAALGGRENAFTARDYTGYFQQIPAGRLEDVMKLEADRFARNQWADEEFRKEIEVVKEERRMRTDDNPQAKLFEQMNAVAFQAHPYRRPIIGWMSDLETMTAADARTWYDTWYVPNNATLVIAGDVDHQEVFAQAEKFYGPLEGRPLPVRRPQTEPIQEGIRHLTVKAPAELPVLLMGYKAPVLRDVAKDSDPYALEMLGAVLDGHAAARFGKKLVREDKVAVAAGVEYDSSARGPGMFYLHASPSEGRTVADVEAALRAEIARIQKDGVDEAELKRARAQLVAGQTYKLDSMFAQAMEIGQIESADLSYRDLGKILERLQQVTAAEIQAVAKKYFSDESLTVGILDPQPLDGKPRRPAAATRH